LVIRPDVQYFAQSLAAATGVLYSGLLVAIYLPVYAGQKALGRRFLQKYGNRIPLQNTKYLSQIAQPTARSNDGQCNFATNYPFQTMNEDNSFDALMNPGEAENFFEIADLPEIDPTTSIAYSRTNSLWLMEFSRLIYRQEKDEKPRSPSFTTRDQLLGLRGWREIAFFNKKDSSKDADTQVGIFSDSKGRCAALVFRGTLGLDDTITGANCLPVKWTGSGYVHKGFKSAFDIVWEQFIKPELTKLAIPFFITGHSLGAALATLAAARCLKDGAMAHGRPIALYTFGSPRVGDRDFGNDLKEGVTKVFVSCYC
jgi:hypothetical protein